MGAFDGTLVHLQLLGLAIAFVGGAWVLLREHTPPVLLAATLLAVVTAPAFLLQLQTNFADVPRGDADRARRGVARGRGCGPARPGLLPAAALFLGAGALTKNEGELFALTAFVAALLVAPRAAAAAARVGGAGDVRDRAALADLGAGCTALKTGRLLALQPLRPGVPERPPRPRRAVGAASCSRRSRASRAGATSSRSSWSASRARCCCGAGGRCCSERGGPCSRSPGCSRSTGSRSTRLEPPLQHVRPDDRHARDRDGDARAGAASPRARARAGRALTRPRRWPRGRTARSTSGSRPISSRARDGSGCSEASTDSQT